jgi:5-methylcytosine-specific restriction endonuclease McrA
MDFFSLPRLTESAVRQGLRDRHATDCRNTAELLAFLAVFEERGYYLADGYSSMWAWCMGELHYSEDTAGRRLDVARVARQFPAIFVAIADGRLHLSAVLMLADKLTPQNVDELIAAATHQSKSQIAVMLAHRYPKPDAPTRIVPMPVPAASLTFENANEMSGNEKVSPAPVRVTLAEQPVPVPVPTPLPPPRITPTSPERYKFQFTLTQNTYELLQQAQDLLGHQVATRDVDEVFRRALELLVAKLEKQKFAATDRPRPARQNKSQNPRHIPAEVRRAVRQRDGGQCTYTSPSGHRCECRRVEFDHIVPIARGGKSVASNLRLRCRAHNQFAADEAFGKGFMEEKREARGKKSFKRSTGSKLTETAEQRARAVAAAAVAREQIAALFPG